MSDQRKYRTRITVEFGSGSPHYFISDEPKAAVDDYIDAQIAMSVYDTNGRHTVLNLPLIPIITTEEI